MQQCNKAPDPSRLRFTNTWIGDANVSYTYLTYKWALAILFMVGLVQSIIQNTLSFMELEETENIFKYFIYLTNNGRLVACAAGFLEAVLVSLRWRKEKTLGKDIVEDENCLPVAMKVLWIMSNISSSLSVIISLVYWTALYNPDRHYLDFENFSGHLLIAAANMLDVFISDRPWRMLHAIHPIIFAGVFGVFSFIYFLAGGTNYYFEPYVYHIIDWAHPMRTMLVIGGVTVFFVIFHSFFFLMYKMRLVCSKRYKMRKEMTKDTGRTMGGDKSEALLDNYQTRGEVEC